MGRPSFREKLIASGVTTVHQRGFSTAGLREITAAAGVAQGSFTNHFGSKEEFGLAVLNRYFEQIEVVIGKTLKDARRAPLDRIDAYFDAITALFADSGWRYGCLVANLALEAVEHSGKMRDRLSEIFAAWTSPFAETLHEARAVGEVPANIDAAETAAALLEAWHGAVLRLKIDRSPAALERFRHVTLPALTRAAVAH